MEECSKLGLKGLASSFHHRITENVYIAPKLKHSSQQTNYNPAPHSNYESQSNEADDHPHHTPACTVRLREGAHVELAVDAAALDL